VPALGSASKVRPELSSPHACLSANRLRRYGVARVNELFQWNGRLDARGGTGPAPRQLFLLT